MNNLTQFNVNDLVLSGDDVRKKFDANYITMLYQKHCIDEGLPLKYLINFVHTSQLSGADPRLNQIYLIPRNTRGKNGAWEKVGTIVYSYQFFLGIVQSHRDYEGMETYLEIREKTSPQFQEKNNEYGKKEYVLLPELKTIKELCSVTNIYRKSKKYTYEAWISDYCDPSSPKWRNNFSYMLRKCSEAGAARHAFSDIVQGFYVEEEIGAFESEKTNDAIEATATVINEKETLEKAKKRETSQIESREKIENISEFEKIIEEIKKFSSVLCAGKTVQEKGEWMLDRLGINSFKDLSKGSLEFITNLRDGLDAEIRIMAIPKKEIHGASIKSNERETV